MRVDDGFDYKDFLKFQAAKEATYGARLRNKELLDVVKHNYQATYMNRITPGAGLATYWENIAIERAKIRYPKASEEC